MFQLYDISLGLRHSLWHVLNIQPIFNRDNAAILRYPSLGVGVTAEVVKMVKSAIRFVFFQWGGFFLLKSHEMFYSTIFIKYCKTANKLYDAKNTLFFVLFSL